MKRYGQRCPLARGLDVIGDRWSLLIVRDLLLGPRRYTDLQDGLPGIGTNVLAARLRDLHASGIVTRRALPPPAGATVYELTAAGRALRPALTALRTWGAEHAPPPRPDDAIRPAWALMSATSRTSGRSQPAPGTVCELRLGADIFRLAVDEAGLTVRSGPAHQPDATITMNTETFYALVTNRTTTPAAYRQSTIDGDGDIATHYLTALRGAVADQPERQP